MFFNEETKQLCYCGILDKQLITSMYFNSFLIKTNLKMLCHFADPLSYNKVLHMETWLEVTWLNKQWAKVLWMTKMTTQNYKSSGREDRQYSYLFRESTVWFLNVTSSLKVTLWLFKDNKKLPEIEGCQYSPLWRAASPNFLVLQQGKCKYLTFLEVLNACVPPLFFVVSSLQPFHHC